MTEEGRRNEEQILKVLAQWDKDPQTIFEWRDDVFKRLMLLLEDMSFHPKGTPGRRETVQMKAIQLLQNLGAALDELRSKIPVVCPKCEHKFKL
jgi:hypothetical protein